MTNFKVVKLSEEFYEAAVNVFLESFLPDEYLTKTLRAMIDPAFCHDRREMPPEMSSEFKRLYLSMFKKADFKIIAVDSNSNEVLGVLVSRLCQVIDSEKTTHESQEEVYKNPTLLAILEVMSQISDGINPFEHFKAECGIEMILVSIMEKARGRGIAKALFKKLFEAAREYQGFPKPAFLYGYYTSKISFAASRSAFGAEIFKVIPYSEITYKGQSLAQFAPPDAPPIFVGGVKIAPEINEVK